MCFLEDIKGKKIKLDDLLNSCKDNNGKMIRIPIVTSLKVANGEIVCEVEGYSVVIENLYNENKSLLH